MFSSASQALIWLVACLFCTASVASSPEASTDVHRVTINDATVDSPAMDTLVADQLSLDRDELVADQLSVRELMRWETSQALKRVRADRNELPLSTELHGSRSAPDLNTASLVAIYGVGRKLMAEVRIDGATLLFMRGRTNAVGPGKAHRMRLLSLTERCVEVAVDDRQRVICATAHVSTGG